MDFAFRKVETAMCLDLSAPTITSSTEKLYQNRVDTSWYLPLPVKGHCFHRIFVFRGETNIRNGYFRTYSIRP